VNESDLIQILFKIIGGSFKAKKQAAETPNLRREMLKTICLLMSDIWTGLNLRNMKPKIEKS